MLRESLKISLENEEELSLFVDMDIINGTVFDGIVILPPLDYHSATFAGWVMWKNSQRTAKRKRDFFELGYTHLLSKYYSFSS